MATLKEKGKLRTLISVDDERIKAIGLNPDDFGYIYLIKCNEFYKLGISYDVVHRLESLQTGNPYELELVLAARIPQTLEFEKIFHEMLAEYRERREWFKLPEKMIERLSKMSVKIWEEVKENNLHEKT